MSDRLHYVARALDHLIVSEDAAHDAYFATADHPGCEPESRRLLVSLGESCGARAMAYRLARQLLVVRVDAPGAMALAASLAAQGVPMLRERPQLVAGARLRFAWLGRPCLHVDRDSDGQCGRCGSRSAPATSADV